MYFFKLSIIIFFDNSFLKELKCIIEFHPKLIAIKICPTILPTIKPDGPVLIIPIPILKVAHEDV